MLHSRWSSQPAKLDSSCMLDGKINLVFKFCGVVKYTLWIFVDNQHVAVRFPSYSTSLCFRFSQRKLAGGTISQRHQQCRCLTIDGRAVTPEQRPTAGNQLLVLPPLGSSDCRIAPAGIEMYSWHPQLWVSHSNSRILRGVRPHSSLELVA